MAKLVTLQLLVDSDDEASIADGVNEMLRNAQLPANRPDEDARSWLIDWRLGFCGGNLLLQPISASIEDAIVNNTYSEGDAFPSAAAPLHPGFEYELLASDPAQMDSLWITVPSHQEPSEAGDLSVLLKRTHEGVIVDVWPTRQEDAGELLASTAAMYADAALPEPVCVG